MVKKIQKDQVSKTLSNKKVKATAIDGFGSVERQKLSSAIRQVWQRSKQWRIVKARCVGEKGYSFCEKCKLQAPKIFVDHIEPIGAMEEPGYFERLMISSEGLQGLCKECHAPKTKKDNAKTKETKKKIAAKKKVVIVEPEDDDDLEVITIDQDIQDMDIFTYRKFELQRERNKLKESEINISTFI